jgi:hypothetical protein
MAWMLRLILLASVPAAAPVWADNFTYTPTHSEKRTLARKACSGTVRTNLEAIVASRYEYSDGPQYLAEVTCVSHASIGGFAARYIADCFKGRGTWHCNAAELVLEIPVGGITINLELSSRVSPAQSAEILAYAMSVKEFQSFRVRDWLKGRCSITLLDPASWDVNCGGFHVAIAKDCAANRCAYRMFLAERRIQEVS